MYWGCGHKNVYFIQLQIVFLIDFWAVLFFLNFFPCKDLHAEKCQHVLLLSTAYNIQRYVIKTVANAPKAVLANSEHVSAWLILYSYDLAIKSYSLTKLLQTTIQTSNLLMNFGLRWFDHRWFAPKKIIIFVCL